MVPALHGCLDFLCKTTKSSVFSRFQPSKRYFSFIFTLSNSCKIAEEKNSCPESMNLQYFSILPSSSEREYGLANVHISKHHAANLMNVTGGGAYDNKEVNEESQAGSCFARNRVKPYICQLGKDKH